MQNSNRERELRRLGRRENESYRLDNKSPKQRQAQECVGTGEKGCVKPKIRYAKEREEQSIKLNETQEGNAEVV